MTPSVIFGTLKLVMTSFDLGGRRPTLYSGRHNGTPGDHPCKILAPCDVNCGRESAKYVVTDRKLTCNYIYRYTM